MVENVAVNRSVERPGRPNSSEKTLRLKLDVPLLLVTITLIVFGVLMLYSASWDVSFRFMDEPAQMFNRQMMWLGLGLVSLLVFSWFDYRIWSNRVVIVMLVTIGILLLVLFIGDSTDGTTRTLRGNSYQPSELAKLMTILYLSVWLFKKKELVKTFDFGFLPLASILGIVAGLIFIQPDLSAGATIIILGGIMFFVAGGDLKQISALVGIALVIVLLIVSFSATGQARIDSYLAGLRDPLQSSDHVQHSLSAIARGGWFGVGLGQGKMKLIVLPVPHTDSIFAVIGEEFGVFGIFVVVLLFGILFWRGLSISRQAPDGLGALMASGITIWITMEAVMNMLALTGMMPFAGNPLPFFSLGGSSLLFTLTGIGILLNISRCSEEKKLEEDRRLFGALINLRGWDRRRGVSRARRS